MDVPTKKRILCVDDSHDCCELLSCILDMAGYEIETAQSINEGLRLAGDGNFNLYLIDLFFSDGTGFELIENIRKARSLDSNCCLFGRRARVHKE